MPKWTAARRRARGGLPRRRTARSLAGRRPGARPRRVPPLRRRRAARPSTAYDGAAGPRRRDGRQRRRRRSPGSARPRACSRDAVAGAACRPSGICLGHQLLAVGAGRHGRRATRAASRSGSIGRRLDRRPPGATRWSARSRNGTGATRRALELRRRRRAAARGATVLAATPRGRGAGGPVRAPGLGRAVAPRGRPAGRCASWADGDRTDHRRARASTSEALLADDRCRRRTSSTTAWATAGRPASSPSLGRRVRREPRRTPRPAAERPARPRLPRRRPGARASLGDAGCRR